MSTGTPISVAALASQIAAILNASGLTNVNAAGLAIGTQTLAQAIAAKLDAALLGTPGGPASLDFSGKVTTAQLPTNLATLDATGRLAATQIPPALTQGLTPRGAYNASTNTPTISASGVGGVRGDVYVVSVAGTVAADGVGACGIGDLIINNGSLWQRIPFSTTLGTMSAQSAAAVAITGGSATGLSQVALSTGDGISASFLVPDMAFAFRDAAGNICGYVDQAGAFHFGTASGQFTGTVAGATISAPTFTNLASLPFSTGDKFSTGGLVPDLAWAFTDPAGNINGYMDRSGGWNFGGLAATTGTFLNLNATNFAPASIPFGTTQFQTASALVPDFSEVKTDGSGNVVGGARRSGQQAQKPLQGDIIGAIQPVVTRSIRMTQGAPTFEGSSIATADTGTQTYHLCCTLDSYFDAIRILLPCGTLTTSNTVKVSVAPSAAINDYINPLDATGTAVPWTPVTFGNNGTDVDWFDQPFGATSLPLSVATTGSDTVLNFASGVSAIEVGAPVYGRPAQAGTVVTAINSGSTPQTVTLSKPLDTTNLSNAAIGAVFWFGKLTGTLQACPVGQSVQITPSDWVGCSAQERSDVVGAMPILMVRVVVTGTPVPISGLPSGVLHTGWGNLIGERIWSCRSAAGDFVTTPTGFAGADNGKSMVFAVQYMSRARGSSTLAVGDSVVQGVNGTVAGMGAVALSHLRMSTLACPITQVIVPNGWANNSGFPVTYYPTARAMLSMLRPNIIMLESWSRNNTLTNGTFTQADADQQWQWNMMLSEKAARWGCQPFIFPAWPNTSMTSGNDAIRISALTRGAEMAASGVMFFNGDAVVGTGSAPVTQQTQYVSDGLHLNPTGQNAYAANISQIIKAAIGV